VSIGEVVIVTVLAAVLLALLGWLICPSVVEALRTRRRDRARLRAEQARRDEEWELEVGLRLVQAFHDDEGAV
jgi:hypothetical protein